MDPEGAGEARRSRWNREEATTRAQSVIQVRNIFLCVRFYLLVCFYLFVCFDMCACFCLFDCFCLFVNFFCLFVYFLSVCLLFFCSSFFNQFVFCLIYSLNLYLSSLLRLSSAMLFSFLWYLQFFSRRVYRYSL